MNNIEQVKARRLRAFARAVTNDVAVVASNARADDLQRSHNRVVKAEDACIRAGTTASEMMDAAYSAVGAKAENYVN